VRRRQLLAKIVVVAIVGVEFHIAQVQAGKKFVLFENEIRDYDLLRARPEIERMQLFESSNEKRQLRLEPRSSLALIESLQKGIVFRLHHALRIQTLSQHPSQCALADTYRPFYCNVAGQFKKVGHGSGGPWQHISGGAERQLREKLT